MTGNTTARTQAVELAERLREVAAWNVRLHLAKEELEQQALCEAAGVTKATISARMNLDAPGTPHRRQVRPVENKRLLPNHNDGDRSKPVPPERVELSLSD